MTSEPTAPADRMGSLEAAVLVFYRDDADGMGYADHELCFCERRASRSGGAVSGRFKFLLSGAGGDGAGYVLADPPF